MLTQSYRREVPEHDAFLERTLFRDPHFCVAIVRSRNLVMDPGVLGPASSHRARFRRPQLTVVLRGRGYLALGDRIVELRAGDFARTDQRSHRGEGYGGEGSEVLVVDWSDDGEETRRASDELGRLGARSHARLRALVGCAGRPSAETWIAALAAELRELTGDALPIDARAIAPVPAPLAELYAALGPALSRLDLQPSLSEIAGALGMSERHANRMLVTLARDYDHPFLGWRELVHGMRLGWATQILSLPGVPLARVASLAGYRSSIALHHACSLRGAPTPRTLERELRARWR